MRVDMIELKIRHLEHAQAGAIRNTEGGDLLPVARYGFQQSRRYLNADSIWQPSSEIAGDHRTQDRFRRCNATRNTDPARRDGRRSQAALMLF